MSKSISSEQAAKIIIKHASRIITNLDLHKLLYIANMLYIGANNHPLIREQFEAWDYGPVVPSLYQDFKKFGSEKIWDYFDSKIELAEDQEEYQISSKVSEHFSKFKASELVSITHRRGGAWQKSYRPNIKNIKISNKDILNEYNQIYHESCSNSRLRTI